MNQLKILFLESFYGGSHGDFASGIVQNSGHDIQLISLKDRFWKWRMKTAALQFLKKLPSDDSEFDLIFSTDLINLCDLRAFWPGKAPIVLYFHETQITYPIPKGENQDYSYAFQDCLNAHLSEQILFNSSFHRFEFFKKSRKMFSKFPEKLSFRNLEDVEEKSMVVYPGCHLSRDREIENFKSREDSKPPLILWNHRWEFDKKPEDFFSVLRQLKSSGVKFRLAVVGESSQVKPKVFEQAREDFAQEIEVWGYLPGKEEYYELLEKADIVISTAIQENFGISVVEAMAYACIPLLPMRLSYPEVLPAEFHKKCLYRGLNDLKSRLLMAINNPRDFIDTKRLSNQMSRYRWSEHAIHFDRVFEQVAHNSKRKSGVSK